MEESKTVEVRATLLKALVIGISDYSNVSGEGYHNLDNSINDANDVAKLL